jgi:hypothetical protein
LAQVVLCPAIDEGPASFGRVRSKPLKCLIARVELTPDERRGLTEFNGEGEALSGIALQRFVAKELGMRLRRSTPELPTSSRAEVVS